MTQNAVCRKNTELLGMFVSLQSECKNATKNNLSLTGFLVRWAVSTSTPFPGLFCLWEAWRRRSSCWRGSEPAISSGATFRNTSTSRAGRISWRPPGLPVCSICVKVCWKRTGGAKETEYHQKNYVKIIVVAGTTCKIIHRLTENNHVTMLFHSLRHM